MKRSGLSAWKQALSIGAIALVVAFTFNALRAEAGGIPVKHTPKKAVKAAGADTLATPAVKLAEVDFAEVDNFFRNELATFVDAREAQEYAQGHIPGAVNITVEGFKSGKQKLSVPKGSLVVAYCSGGDCELSHDLAKLMSKAGFKKLRIYTGGFKEWDDLGQPVEK